MIREREREILAGDLTPLRASELLLDLTALLSTVLEEIRTAEMVYGNVLLKCLDADEAANRATIRAHTTPEYARAKEARDTNTVLLEMIRSLKVVLKCQQEEMKLSR